MEPTRYLRRALRTLMSLWRHTKTLEGFVPHPDPEAPIHPPKEHSHGPL